MTCASRGTFHRMTTIGTASNHGLTRFATCCLDFAASVADILSCCALSFHGICFRFARLIANRFFCMRKRHECKN